MIDDTTLSDTEELVDSLIDLLNKSTLKNELKLYCLAEALGRAVNSFSIVPVDFLEFSSEFTSKVAALISSYNTHKNKGS